MEQPNRQTDKQTDGHGNSMTESAQWGRFSENAATKFNVNVLPETCITSYVSVVTEVTVVTVVRVGRVVRVLTKNSVTISFLFFNCFDVTKNYIFWYISSVKPTISSDNGIQ